MNKTFRIFIPFLTFISLLPIFYISYYSRPCVDDFDYSWRTHYVLVDNKWDIVGLIQKMIETDIQFYNHWQGLYSSTILMSLQPGIFFTKAYMLCTFFIIGVLFSALSYFFISFRRYMQLNKTACYILAGVFTCFFCQMMPAPVEGLYWFNGACNYIPFLSCVIINVAFLHRYNDTGKNKYIILSCVNSFIISGANHVTSFLNIMILFVWMIFFHRNKKDIIKCLLPLIVALIGFVIMYTAPGTAIRQDSIGSHADVNACIRESFIYSFRLFGNWMSFSWWCLIALVSFYTYSYVSLEEKKIINPLLLILVLFGMFCGILCVPFYPMWSFGAGRIHNVFFIVFIMFSASLAMNIVIYIKQKYNLSLIDKKFSNIICALITTIFICSFTFNSNSTALKAIKECQDGTAQSFAQDFDDRIEMIEQAKRNNNKQLLLLKPLTQSELLRFDDITSDTCDWRNKSFSKYYGVVVAIK